MDSLITPILSVLNAALKNLSKNQGGDLKNNPFLTSLDLEYPPDSALGDFAFPCFKLSKLFRKSPVALAQLLFEELQKLNASPQPQSQHFNIQQNGPYVNFFMTEAFLLTQTLPSALQKETFGKRPEKSQEKWVIEFSSPNLAKPMNIYHLRGTVLGASLARIARWRGYDVTSINHLGDWGTPIGKMAIAFERYQKDLPANPQIEDLVSIYVRINQEESESPELEEKAREAFHALENKDPKVTAIWKKCVEVSLYHLKEKIYKPFGIEFDYIWPESFYQDKMEPVLQTLRSKGILEKDAGAEIVRVTTREGKELPPCLLVKSDGSTIYATRDIAAALYRHTQLHFDRMFYIVGGEQRLHFEQIFSVLRKAGFEWEKNCEHIPTGLVRFKDAKMSTRKGNFITLLSVLENAKEEVQKIIESRPQAQFSEQELEKVIQDVALGALIFNDLSVDPARDVEFDLNKILDFDGETGPYLQYAHTRCLSLLQKAHVEHSDFFPLTLTPATFQKKGLHLKEIELLRMISKFPIALDKSLEARKVNLLAYYLIDLTKAFNQFYRECRVLSTDPDETHFRLLLTFATKNTLALGLSLLGVPLPTKM